MDIENSNYEAPQTANGRGTGSDSLAAQSILDGGAVVYGRSEPAESDVCDKTAQVVNETYEQAKSYSRKNPGRQF